MNYNRKGVFHVCLSTSVLLLLLHCYYYCSDAAIAWGWMPAPALKVMAAVEGTGFFRHIWVSRIMVLVFLGLFLLGSPRSKARGIGHEVWLILLGLGLSIFFGSSYVFRQWVIRSTPAEEAVTGDIFYLAASILGYVMILVAGNRLSGYFPSWLKDDDPFGRRRAGFPQETRRRASEYSLHFEGRHRYRGRERKSWINVMNPRRGMLVIGNPGCGKSWFIIEPCIRQLMEKGMAMFIYDFKYDTLTQLAYNLFLQNKDKYPPGTGFYVINFSDPSRSHRCNVLDPAGMEWLSDAIGVSRQLLYSLNKTWLHRQGDFFVESPINFLAALIWFLKKYEGGKYCTLPHVIELAQVGYEELFSLLNLEPEVRALISPFIEAYRDGIMDMLDSQVASARVPLGRLASPDLYYVLTGDDCSLDINDPAAPKILCLGGNPRRQEALAPVLSLFIDQLNKQVNRAGRLPCALVCDEFATVRAYSMTAILATARSNHIVPILAVQDLNQLRTQYSREEADMMLNIAGNVFCGQVGGETALRVSERFPKVLQENEGMSTNSNDTSFSQTQQWAESVSLAAVANLSSGEFVGVVADDPDKPLEYKAFHAKLIRQNDDQAAFRPLPIIREISPNDIAQCFLQVKLDIEVLVKAELDRLIGDADLRGLRVKKASI